MKNWTPSLRSTEESIVNQTSFRVQGRTRREAPSLYCNFISTFGHYLHVNHSQHEFHKPLWQVLPQKTSLKSLSKIHFKAVLEGLDFKIFFDSFFR